MGDFNGDGRLDLAFPLANRDVVSLLIGDDAGGFVEPQIDISLAPHAAGPIALVAGRFNGNGSLDVAVANSLTGNVSVLLDFDGTAFASIQHIWTGLSPRALAAGDLDRDGDLDLVVADEWTGRISILSNHGQGTFSVIKPPVQVAAAPFAVVVAQLNDDNGDGRIDEADHLDVAVACFGSDPDPSDPGGVWILRNDGNGTLTVTERHVAGRAPSSLAAVDLDRDGELDLVVANYLSNDVSVFTNDGGTFTLKHVARGGFGPMDIVAVDIDRDSCVDLAVTGGGMTRVSILRNLGGGMLADAKEHFPDSSRADFPTSRPVSVVGGPINREGLSDLAVANGKTGEIWIVSNVSSGTGVGAAADGDPYAPPLGMTSGDGAESFPRAAETVLEIPPSRQTPFNRLDVNRDGVVGAADVLRVVNFLNQHGAISLHNSPLPDSLSLLFDADGDDWVTPTDVLLLVNHVNAQPLGEGEAGDASERNATGRGTRTCKLAARRCRCQRNPRTTSRGSRHRSGDAAATVRPNRDPRSCMRPAKTER